MASLTTPRRHRSRYQRARPPGHAPLRVAIFADSSCQPHWLVEAMGALARADWIELVLVVAPSHQAPSPHGLWQAYRRAESHLFRLQDDPDQPDDLHRAAPRAPWVDDDPVPGPGKTPAWHASLTGKPALDVVFALGNLDDEVFQGLARYGVWRYCFGPRHLLDQDQAGLQEVMQGLPLTVSGLRVRLWPGVSRLLYRSTSRTNPFSLGRNRANLLHKTSRFALRELAQLHRLGPGHLNSLGQPLPPLPAQTDPSLGESLKGLARVGQRILTRSWQKLSQVDQWSLAFRFGPSGWNGSMEGWIPLQPTLDRIWADPFPLIRDGRHYIFFEEVPLAINKGHISVLEVFPDGSHTEPKRVLEEDYHLSYPFLIESEGSLYMIPESGANRDVALYRCRRFPDHWERVTVLLSDVDCADATLHQGPDGHWWMFVNIGAPGTELYDELHIYHADQLTGPWLPHPENPVKSDVCSARPAGRLFLNNGHLYRPAQICAPLYGTGIAINQVQELTLQTYKEQVVERILPPAGSGLLGIHTLNRAGKLNVIDCFARLPRF